MPLNAGELKHTVNVQALSQTRGAMGSSVETWASGTEVWAKIEPLSNREMFAAQQVKNVATHRITIRYFAGLTTSQRLRHVVQTTRFFNIISIRDIEERHEFMELLCQELVQGA